MSTEQSLDPQLIEQTKQQIRSLVAEIAQLTKENLTPEEFYGQFLTRVVSALAAIGGAVWTLNDEGRLALQYQVNLQQTNLRDNEEGQIQHSRLLYKALNEPEGLLVPPHSGTGDDNEAGNPTEFLLVLGPLKTDLETAGVLEIIQRAEPGPATQRGYQRFVLQMCELAADFLKSHQLRRFSDRQILWTQLEEFTRTVHASLDPRTTAYTIANEGRRLIECDRVSVALRRGNRFLIEAVSGQDVFDKRSNTIRLLGKLATAVVATGDPVWYAGDTRDMAPQVEDAVQEYVDESHTKNIAVLPLKRTEPEEEAEPGKRQELALPVGALIVEQIEDSRVPPSMVQRVEVVCRHSSAALANAMEHESLFLMPVWRAIGKSRWIVQARTLPKTVTVGVALLVVLLWLCIWPARFEVHSKGTLEPVRRQDVWAQVDGQVVKLHVEHGKTVRKGDLLATMDNPKLAEEIAGIEGERDVSRQGYWTARTALTEEKQISPAERTRLLGEMATYNQRTASLEKQLELYRQEEAELKVRSPIDGIVVTWDLDKLLMKRPVQQGQRLMQIADPTGDWELQLHMPESRTGYIADAQNRQEKTDLDVTYQTATDPGVNLQGLVREVQLGAETRPDEGNVVLVKVNIDKSDLTDPRPGAEVSAKIYCGRRPIGYVWFHDLVGFIQSRILFRYF